jgi:hypothetical protein
MSKIVDIKSILDKFRREKPEPLTVSSSLSPSRRVPDFVAFNCENNPTEVVLVQGLFNAVLMKGFGIPVVGLDAWYPEYKDRAPFRDLKLGEVVISRVPHEVKPPAEFADAAKASADLNRNIELLVSIAKDTWIRKRCIVSNAGVFSMAQRRRLFGTDFLSRYGYLKVFSEFPATPEGISTLCIPPLAPERAPEPSPTAYLTRNIAVNPYSPAIEVASGSASRYDPDTARFLSLTRHAEPSEGLDIVDRLGGNPPPTEEQRQSVKDWNKS